MQVKVEIGFDQLMSIVKELPASKLRQLKAVIENGVKVENLRIDLETLLLNGPTATKKEILTIEQNRKSINQWTTKL